MIYDLVIIGGGPAGVSAAVYAARKKLNTLFITKDWGGQSVVSEKIFNWIGSPSISGMELAENMKKHVLVNSKKEDPNSTLDIEQDKKVNSIKKENDVFILETEKGNIETKNILIATGSSRKKLEAKNAVKLEHKGLTYCASCDGPLFTNMDVVVVGGGNAAFDSAAQLLAYCKSVTLIHRSDKFRADEVTVEKVLSNPKMKAIKNAEIIEILGEKFVEGLIYKDKNSNEIKELKVAGIFVEIGQIPNTSFVNDLVPKDENGRIIIDPRNQKTKISGIWAAGDCTDILYHQNNIAAGDAVRALEDIYLHINAR